MPHTCAKAIVEDKPQPVDCAPPLYSNNQPSTVEGDFDFVERPSQDFFCPVSFELLLEPQLTSCCGHHLSQEAATRLQKEGKACPMCNGGQWSAVLDKYHRRRVREVRVRCRYKDNGCAWVGEVNNLKRHTNVCEKRPWECQYCALKCMYGEGEEKHWPACLKFPEPCPNKCEVGCVERCNVEQHRQVCSLEPVACEMKEFGCNVVVPRKELATHMKESELQHLTAMTLLNLSLSRQLQRDSTERDRKITQLQQEVAELNKQQTEMHLGLKTKLDKLQLEIHTSNSDYKRDLTERIQRVERIAHHIEQHTGGEACSGCEVFTFTQYGTRRGSRAVVYSDPFYSHHHGYKLQMKLFYSPNSIGVYFNWIEGEYDDQLHWPVEAKVRLELLNQAGDRHHVVKTKNCRWKKGDTHFDLLKMGYTELERQGGGATYMMNDRLKFKIWVTVV